MILLGLSRAGKTSVGQLLAERFGCSFYDTDELIRIRTGLTPRQLCRQAGISALHAAEAAALRECCGRDFAATAQLPTGRVTSVPTDNRHDTTAESRHGTALTGDTAQAGTEHSVVIAAGGGICDNAEASAIIAAIPQRVFLYAEEAALFERLTHDALQTGYYPAFLHFLPVVQKAEARRLFAELYAQRNELYRKSCNLIIDTTGLDCPAIVQKIVEQFGYFFASNRANRSDRINKKRRSIGSVRPFEPQRGSTLVE